MARISTSPTDPRIGEIKDHAARLFAFAQERHRVYERRAAGKPQPWTLDPIIAEYRFCCVYRELDRVTRWIARNWRDPHADDPDLWFAMCAARLFNREETLDAMGWPVPWRVKPRAGQDRADSALRALARLKQSGEKVFSAAYIVSTNGTSQSKVVYLFGEVLGPLWDARERIRPRPGDTLQSYHLLLGGMQGFGSFMTAQVIADLKYASGSPLNKASDWWTFAASGPGSRRGLRRVLGRPATRDQGAEAWKEDEWRLELGRLREQLAPMLKKAGMPEAHGQDVQNMLCEFDKYERARLGEGRPKQRFRPRKEN